MIGMDTVIALREQRAKPACVMVELVKSIDPGQPPLAPSGIVTVQIPSSDSLADIDLRPLVGLYVQTFDYTGDRERHRRLSKLIADVNPSLLVMHDGETFHIREADGSTRSYYP